MESARRPPRPPPAEDLPRRDARPLRPRAAAHPGGARDAAVRLPARRPEGVRGGASGGASKPTTATPSAAPTFTGDASGLSPRAARRGPRHVHRVARPDAAGNQRQDGSAASARTPRPTAARRCPAAVARVPPRGPLARPRPAAREPAAPHRPRRVLRPRPRPRPRPAPGLRRAPRLPAPHRHRAVDRPRPGRARRSRAGETCFRGPGANAFRPGGRRPSAGPHDPAGPVAPPGLAAAAGFSRPTAARSAGSTSAASRSCSGLRRDACECLPHCVGGYKPARPRHPPRSTGR